MRSNELAGRPGVLFLIISRRVDSQERTERKKAVQEMNEGELLTALREKLKNIEAAGKALTLLLSPSITGLTLCIRIF